MIDLKSWEKIGDTKSHMIYEHPDGHQMHVAKMPKFAEGTPDGPIQKIETIDPNLASAALPQANQAPSAETMFQPGVASPVQNESPVSTQLNPQTASAVDPYIKPNDTFGIESQAAATEKGLGQQLGGINAEAAAKGALGQAQAGEQELGAGALEQNQKTLEKHVADVHALIDPVLHDISNAHIDPQRLYKNMDTSSKIESGIGLILGGIGGGLTHQENPVLKMMNNAIDRDVEAQKADINNKHTLVAAYNSQVHNWDEAAQMASATIKNATGLRFQAAADAAQDPIQKAAAMQASGAALKQAAGEVGSIASRRAILGNAGGGLPGAAPQGQSQGNAILDPNVKLNMPGSRAVNLFAKITAPNATPEQLTEASKGANELAGLKSNANEIAKAMGAANARMGEPASWVFGNIPLEEARTAVMPLLKTMVSRISGPEQEQMNTLMPGPLDWISGNAQNKIQAMMRISQAEGAKHDSAMRAVGVDPIKFEDTDLSTIGPKKLNLMPTQRPKAQ